MSKVYRTQVVERLKDLADADFQYRSWVRADPSAGMSSYEEAICQLFDDTGLGDVLASKRSHVVFDLGTDAILRRLSAEVEKVDDSDPNTMLNHPQMVKVRDLARQALESILVNHDQTFNGSS